MLEEEVVSTLKADGAVSATVSDRVFPGRRPQGSSLPAVVIHRIDGVREYVTSGIADLVSSRMQIDSWAKTYKDAKLLSRAVRDALSGLQDGIIQGAFIDGERDFSEEGSDQSEYLYRTSLDFTIWHTE